MARHAVVIGGGVIGVCSAHYLSLGGWQVTLIERGEIGRGCSYGNVCLIVPSHSHPLPEPGVLGQALRWMARRDSPFHVRPRLDPQFLRWAWQFRRHCTPDAARRGFEALLRLSRGSADLFEQLAGSLVPGFLHRRQGLLHVYVSDAGVEAARREHDELRRAGFRTTLLSGSEATQFEPALSDRVRGAMFIEGEAHADSFGFVRALAADLDRRGVTILTNCTVLRVRVARGRAAAVTLGPAAPGGARRAGVPEEITADLVVLAAGAWSPSLARPLGINLPMQPAKGYSCTIDAFDGMPAMPVLIGERRVIITPLENRVRFGGTLELAGFDLSIDRVRYGTVVRAAHGILRTPPSMRGEEPWCGLRPVTPDGLPVVDWARGVEGLLLATGHAMLGLTQGPMTGRLVAELADGAAPSVPIHAFRSDRFGRAPAGGRIA